MSDIYQKLAKIQRELKAPKGQFNKFGGYNYRSCEDILEAVKPLLGSCMLLLSDQIIQMGDRYYVKAVACFKDEQTQIITEAYAREEETKKGMDASQITGAASSYARKYALNGLFLIDDTKDSDATNQHDKAPIEPAKVVQDYVNAVKEVFPEATEIMITKEQTKKIVERVRDMEKSALKQLVVETIGTFKPASKMTTDEAEKLIGVLYA